MPDDPDSDDISLPGKTSDDIYRGKKEKCDHCSREFTWGEVIIVSKDPELVFCAPAVLTVTDAAKSCWMQWTIVNKTGLRAEVNRFQGE